jgi:outer membrane protein OmpA-like peptidoglycan-associated protein
MKKYIVLLIAITFSLSFAQKAQLKKGDKNFNNFSYIQAIKIYEKVAAKGYKSKELYQRIADSYYFNADYINASSWYEKLFKIDPTPLNHNYYFRFSNCLRTAGQIDKADAFMKQFLIRSNENDTSVLSFQNYLNNPKFINKLNDRYVIKNLSSNTHLSEYGGVIMNDTMYFTSSLQKKENKKYARNKWNNQPFTEIAFAKIDSSFTPFPNIEWIEGEVNSFLHESSPVFTKDGKYVYFTRNNFIKGKKKKNKENEIALKIYRAEYTNGKWNNVFELPFNSNDFNCAHPALSKDDKTLYFSSNRPGSFGESDLYKVTVLDNFLFSEPENLGTLVNTKSRESFPFVSNDDILYFSSDGHYGFGGLDVFGVALKNNTPQGTVYNLGKPLNSNYDDFAYYINDHQKGFISSNREKGKGLDDIYSFVEKTKTPLNENYIIFGKVTEVNRNKILKNVLVTLLDAQKNKLATTFTDENGKYIFENIEPEKYYFINFNMDEYDVKEDYIDVNYPKVKYNKDAELLLNKLKIEIGNDIAKVLNLTHIYFDLDKWDITELAESDLAKVLEVMTEFKNCTIEIRSHTDSRQTFTYNEILSQKRAITTKNWLVNKGINASRLTTKGCGEKQLVNECSDGVDCSEAQHQQNRRSEFIIMKL